MYLKIGQSMGRVEFPEANKARASPKIPPCELLVWR